MKFSLMKILFFICSIFLYENILYAEELVEINIFVSESKQSKQTEEILLQQLSELSHKVSVDIYIVKKSNTLKQDIDYEKDLNVSIGTTATRYLLNKEIKSPVYSILVPEVTFNKLLNKFEHNKKKVKQGTLSALFIDQSLSRYLSLIKLLGSDIKNIGMFQGEEQIKIDQKHALTDVDRFHLIYQFTYENQGSVSQLEKILERSDAIIIRPGKYLNPFVSKWILYSAYRKKIPVISFSENYLEAGSVASLTNDIKQYSSEASKNIIGYLLNRNEFPENNYPEHYKLSINRSAAYFLGIKLTDKPTLD